MLKDLLTLNMGSGSKFSLVGVSDLGDPQRSRPVNLSLRAPA
jgi:hypothetical protein